MLAVDKYVACKTQETCTQSVCYKKNTLTKNELQIKAEK